MIHKNLMIPRYLMIQFQLEVWWGLIIQKPVRWYLHPRWSCFYHNQVWWMSRRYWFYGFWHPTFNWKDIFMVKVSIDQTISNWTARKLSMCFWRHWYWQLFASIAALAARSYNKNIFNSSSSSSISRWISIYRCISKIKHISSINTMSVFTGEGICEKDNKIFLIDRAATLI